MLRWLSKVTDEDASDLIKQKSRLACRGELLKNFDNKFITPREYEIVSAYLCKLAGASNAYVTKFSGDAGIDFLALIPASTKSYLFPSTSRYVRIVGQAKYWDSPIQRSAIQQLDDTLQDIRHGNYKMMNALPDWFFSEGPIIGCFLSHSHAQSGAIAEAKQRGIIIGDTRDIVEHLVLDDQWSPESTSIEEHVKSQIKGYTN
jgi:hypothetical protein